MATQDVDAIRAWYTKGPLMNFGGATGGSLVAVDIDSPDAMLWLEELEFAYGVRVPHTIATQSGRNEGGHHLTFRSSWPDVKSGKRDPTSYCPDPCTSPDSITGGWMVVYPQT